MDMTKFIAISAAILIGFSMIVALAFPFIVLWYPKVRSQSLIKRAKCFGAMSALTVSIILAQVFGISLTHHGANVAMVFISLACGFSLSLFLFRMLPTTIGFASGAISLVACCLLSFFLLMNFMLEENSPRTGYIGNNMYCRQTAYGFVTSDSGVTLEVFKRFLLFDKRVEYDRRSDIYPESNKVLAPSTANIMSRCADALSKISMMSKQ